MLAGEWFDPHDEELTADRDRATLLMHRLNAECPGPRRSVPHRSAQALSRRGRIHPRTLLLRLRLQHLHRRRLFRQFRLRLPRSGPDPYRTQYADRPQSAAAHPAPPAGPRPACDWPRSRQTDHHRRQLLAGRRRHRLSGRPDRRRRDNWSGFGSYARHSCEFGCRRQSGPRHPYAFTYLTATPLCLPPAIPISNR